LINSVGEFQTIYKKKFPNLRNLVSQVTLPSFDIDDTLAWNHTSDGELSLKEAYRFKKHNLVKLP
jgi:hypothetical protein